MASSLLDLHVTVTQGPTVIEVGGEIDVASAPELRGCLYQAIEAGRRQLVIDLRLVDFIDSVGLGVLVGASNRLRGSGRSDGWIRLICPDGPTLRLLRLTGLHRVFPVHATLTDALG